MPSIPARRKSYVSLDTETTGVDLHHGAKPFLVSTCDEDGANRFWEWDVDPVTREPAVVEEDLEQIREVMRRADVLVFQNPKFDAAALSCVTIEVPWEKVVDTLLGGHLLASNHAHDLTSMLKEHLGEDIQHLEDAAERVVKWCRAYVKRELPHWKIAGEHVEGMPSVRGGGRDEDKPWKNDMWLPRALALHWAEVGEVPDGVDVEELLTVTSTYANGDTSGTLFLWLYMEKEIRDRGLWAIYESRLVLPDIAFRMEDRGVTVSGVALEELSEEYGVEVALAADECVAIAAKFGHDLELPAGASPNDSIREFFYGSNREVCPVCLAEKKVKVWAGQVPSSGSCPKCAARGIESRLRLESNACLGLEPVLNQVTLQPTLDKGAMEHYESTLPPGDALDFIRLLKGKRSRDTALSYMEGYRRFWLPTEHMNWFKLHPSLNPTGTDTLRWSSNNPNAQNISKKESFNLRRCFGPAPGREWWSMDAKNLELRIPAYEAGETDLMHVFDHPDDPPYYGSYHLVVFDALHPALFAEHGKACKDMFESTWYQWTKNGNFAVIYGCQRRKADETYHVAGAYDKVRDRFPKIAHLSDLQKKLAERRGYVETIPDRSVDPRRGYPILASRLDDGRVSPTTPLNYHVSGTAMWWTCRAMTKCDEQLRAWNRGGWDGFLTMQVHDELVFDCPRGVGPRPWETNLPKMLELKRRMESCGADIGVPTPVSVEYHSETWATGKVM